MGAGHIDHASYRHVLELLLVLVVDNIQIGAG